MPTRLYAALAVVLLLALLVPTHGLAQDAKPDHCTPVSLSSYRVYSLQNVRAVWDSYSAQSRGVCEWRKESGPNTMPACRFGVQLSSDGGAWYGNLCWWGTPLPPLSTSVTPRDMQRVIEDILSLPEVQSRLGPGTLVVEVRAGDQTMSVVTRDGKVATIDGKVLPPTNCYATYLGGYLQYLDPNTKRVWDEYSSDSVGVCRWDAPDRPTGDCTHMVEFAGAQAGIPTYWLCWWGKLVSIQQAGVAVEPDVTITMSRDAWLAVANAVSPGITLLWLYEQGNIAIFFSDAERQAAAKLGRALLGELVAGAQLQGDDPHPSGLPVLRNSAGSPYGFQLPRINIDTGKIDLDDLPPIGFGPNAGVVLGDPRASGIDPLLWEIVAAGLFFGLPVFEDSTGQHILEMSDEELYEAGFRWRDGRWEPLPRQVTVEVEPLPTPGKGAGWEPIPGPRRPSALDNMQSLDPPSAGDADEEPSVLDEIDEPPESRVLSRLDQLYRHGAEAAAWRATGVA